MDVLTLLLSLLPFAFCALFLVALALFAGFLFWRFFSRAKVTPKVDGDVFLAQTRAELLPWSREVFADLSNRWKADWRTIGRRGYFQGAVQSLSRPEEAWLAFHIDHYGWLRGGITMRTSAHEVTLQITWEKRRGLRPPAQVSITTTGQPLGTIRLPDFALMDSAGNAIGAYPHDTGLHIGQAFHPLQMGGRAVAEIGDGWLIQPITLGSPKPALRNVIPDLGPQEEQWLVAALALELYFGSRVEIS